MRVQDIFAFSACILCFGSCVALEGANRTVYHRTAQPQVQVVDTGTQELLRSLRYQLESQQNDLDTLQERIASQELSIDVVRVETEELQNLAREIVRQHGETVDTKLASYTVQGEGFTQDLERLREHGNQLAGALDLSNSRLSNLEKKLEEQTQNLEKLESAVQTLVAALQQENPSLADTSTTTYKVVDGDTLEKIARRHKTTIRKLKEINSLSSDRIYSGQTLKVPE